MVMTSPPPAFLDLAAFTSLLNDVVLYRKQIVLSTIFTEAWVQDSYINGLIHPLSNHLDSVVKILVFFNSTECSGCSLCISFATSEVL